MCRTLSAVLSIFGDDIFHTRRVWVLGGMVGVWLFHGIFVGKSGKVCDAHCISWSQCPSLCRMIVFEKMRPKTDSFIVNADPRL